MKPLYSLFALLSLIVLSGCSKFREDRLSGTWKITRAYYQGLFNRDDFRTGYENGLFVLNRDGSAEYMDNTDTLQGFWDMDYYRINNGDDSQSYFGLEIQLVNFSANRVIYLNFDDFNFQNNFQRIRARDFRSGRDRVVEFSKQ